jgi:hypothetical protein
VAEHTRPPRILECVGARLIYDGKTVTINWPWNDQLRLSADWCVGAEVREIDEMSAVQLVVRFELDPPAPNASVPHDLVAVRLYVPPEQVRLAQQIAHVLGGATVEHVVPEEEADPESDAPVAGEASELVRDPAETVPDAGHWISFQPTRATEELLQTLYDRSAARRHPEHDH